MQKDAVAIEELLRTDPHTAAARLRPFATRGDAQAQLLFGVLLINGLGVDRDPRAALRWFRAAANAEVPMAMNMIGRCLEYGFGTPIDHELAAQWYRRAAGYECDWAIYNYAHLLANGRGVVQDRAAAFAWFRLAAVRGHARAMNFLGLYHENGWETPRDAPIAHAWYRRSAEGDDYRGQFSHASVLAEQGDIETALYWLQRAVTTASARHLRHLAQELAKSPHIRLREFAASFCIPVCEDLPRTLTDIA